MNQEIWRGFVPKTNNIKQPNVVWPFKILTPEILFGPGQEISLAYRRQCLRGHPSRGGSARNYLKLQAVQGGWWLMPWDASDALAILGQSITTTVASIS